MKTYIVDETGEIPLTEFAEWYDIDKVVYYDFELIEGTRSLIVRLFDKDGELLLPKVKE